MSNIKALMNELWVDNGGIERVRMSLLLRMCADAVQVLRWDASAYCPVDNVFSLLFKRMEAQAPVSGNPLDQTEHVR